MNVEWIEVGEQCITPEDVAKWGNWSLSSVEDPEVAEPCQPAPAGSVEVTAKTVEVGTVSVWLNLERSGNF